jgi:hypothetical protein
MTPLPAHHDEDAGSAPTDTCAHGPENPTRSASSPWLRRRHRAEIGAAGYHPRAPALVVAPLRGGGATRASG